MCGSDFQTLDDLAVHKMRIDDFIDVRFVDVGVPGAFGIDDDRRTFLAAVKASRLVDANVSRAGEAQRLHALYRVLLHRRRVAVRAARPVGARLTLVDAEKHVVLVEGIHGVWREKTERFGGPPEWSEPADGPVDYSDGARQPLTRLRVSHARSTENASQTSAA